MEEREGRSKLRYQVAITYESNHSILAESPEEAVDIWMERLHLSHLNYQIREKRWTHGGFRLSVELQEHLRQEDRDLLGEAQRLAGSRTGQDVDPGVHGRSASDRGQPFTTCFSGSCGFS